jgi:ATP-dependent Clp protease ATP-binding subunit ClpA
VILSPAPDSSLERARVTIRLAHGVSVTVPAKYVVRREPSQDGKDKPIQPASVSDLPCRMSGTELQERSASQRQALADDVSAKHVQGKLDKCVFGQQELTALVGRRVENFVGKRRPSKPLSIVVAGHRGSGRTKFVDGLAAALSRNGSDNYIHIDCTSDSTVDLGAIGSAIANKPLPILLFDNIDRIPSQNYLGSFMIEMARLLDDGTVGGQRILRHAVVVLTVLIDDSAATGAYRVAEARPDEFETIVRQTLRGANKLPEDVLDRIDTVAILKPLKDIEQIQVVWNCFCQMAKDEYDVQITNARNPRKELYEFLMAARERWIKAGKSGVRDAARFIADSSNDVLKEAADKGSTYVRARWDARNGRLQLDNAASLLTRSVAKRAIRKRSVPVGVRSVRKRRQF